MTQNGPEDVVIPFEDEKLGYPKEGAILMMVCNAHFSVRYQMFKKMGMSDGKIPYVRSIQGRNDPCDCGSGLKYKRCCINKT